MIDLQHLKTFIMIVATKSFSGAAQALGCAQPTVTHQIQRLEQELGARLFDRVKFARTVVLTDVGRKLYDYATRLLAMEEAFRIAVASVRQKQPTPEPPVIEDV